MTDQPTERAPIRTILIDRFALFRAGARALLEKSAAPFEVVAEGADASDAERYARGHRPDIALIGPSASGVIDGEIAALTAVQATSPKTKTVLIDPVGESLQLIKIGLMSGLNAVMTLETDAEEFLAILLKVAHGEAFIPSRVALNLLRMPDGDDAETSLTDREQEVLSLLATGHTNPEVARELHLSVRTVETHRARIRSKLGLESRAELVEYAVRHRLIKKG